METRKLSLILLSMALFGTPASAQPKQMYWSFGDSIQRANLDGSGVETLVTGLDRVPSIALDSTGGKMYWGDSGRPPAPLAAKIQRANLDGTSVEELVSGTAGGLALNLDPKSRKLYWVDDVANELERANLDGSNIEVLIGTGPLDDPYGLALNLADRKLYWTDFAFDSVFRADLDGSHIELLIMGLNDPQGIAIDSQAGKMYIADLSNNRIIRANLDGSNVEIVVPDGMAGAGPMNIALDEATQKMYWTSYNDGVIRRANVDGSAIEVLVTGIFTAEAIALTAICGNGVVELGEGCDDGNTADGDCCSSTCQYEPNGSPCASDGQVCTLDVCDGAGSCTHPAGNAGTACDDDGCQVGPSRHHGMWVTLVLAALALCVRRIRTARVS
jgi:cysteine-rich repeat protein